MNRSFSICGLLVGLLGAPAGCGIADALQPGEPSIPSDYPQLGSVDWAAIDVVVDGKPLTASGGICTFDDSGVDESKLRFSFSVDHLDFETLGRDEREYSSAADQVEASWFESGSFESGPDCGVSVVSFDGESRYDDIGGGGTATWGTIQLVLCDDDGRSIEISGKFSCDLK